MREPTEEDLKRALNEVAKEMGGEVLTGKKAEDFMSDQLAQKKAYDNAHPEKFERFGYKWNKHKIYRWTDDMDEVSGFGTHYEECCRYMVTMMLNWLDHHKDKALPEYSGFKNVYGLTQEENQTAKELRDYILKDVEEYFGREWGPSGAQYQATTSTVLWIKKHSWDEYAKIKREAKKKGK